MLAMHTCQGPDVVIAKARAPLMWPDIISLEQPSMSHLVLID